ncbi:MAG TPA: hypothetical protein VF989_10800 [Polyangiaceae bacterium]
MSAPEGQRRATLGDLQVSHQPVEHPAKRSGPGSVTCMRTSVVRGLR